MSVGLIYNLWKGMWWILSKLAMRIGRKSGWLHCALYLKQCVSSLQNGSVKS
ncbi:hypothetical protein KY285_008574 [Solanum tuberosum]|nr:hypothetical protein KY285_008574 [Solanum tuberosum]